MLTKPAPICTCCEQEVDELVTAPRRDGSLQPVCRDCREVIFGRGWDVVPASTRVTHQLARSRALPLKSGA